MTRSRRAWATLWWAAAAMLGSNSLLHPAPQDVEPQKPEFLRLAVRMEESFNPYAGRGQLRALRRQARESGQLAMPARIGLYADLIVELLKAGKVTEARETADWLLARVESMNALPEKRAFLYRARALAALREAEVENCVARHNADCCIFPLAGGGQHQVTGPAERAAADYRRFLAQQPEDLGARWLLNLTAMALGQYPEGVEPEYRIPPSAFASDEDIDRFPDVAPQLGLDALNLSGGAIVADFDGDLDLDVVTSSMDFRGPLLAYRNTGDGRFAEVSAESRSDDQLGGLNCISGDYDNDGDLDVLVLRGAWLMDDGQIRNSLLQNDGRGNFTDVTRAAGLADPAYPTQTAAWADYDNDGDLDLFVGNEARPHDQHGGDFPCQLFRNAGDGTFQDVAAAAGVTNDRYCKGVAAGDFDNDGWIDFYVSNRDWNRLYRNQGDGTFRDEAKERGVLGPRGSFATWFFDHDNDGHLDLFVAAFDATLEDVAADRLGQPFDCTLPALFHNRGDGTFEDVAGKVGLNRAWLPMGANFGDLDSDGYPDICLATGDPNYESLYPNAMLRNRGGERYVDVTTAGGFGHLQKGHGVVFADLDNDGDQDVFQQLGGFYAADKFHNALFLNPGQGHRYLYLRLVGTKSNRMGFGARVKVEVATADGSRTIHRAVGSVSSFGGSPRRLEIGLGEATRVERVTVVWPVSGETQTYQEVPLDAYVQITEGEAEWQRLPLEPITLNTSGNQDD